MQADLQAQRLARLLLRVLPGRHEPARRRLAVICERAAGRPHERLELVAAVGQRALRRSAGILASEFAVLVHCSTR